MSQVASVLARICTPRAMCETYSPAGNQVDALRRHRVEVTLQVAPRRGRIAMGRATANCRILFAESTADCVVRQASVKALRLDNPATAVVWEGGKTSAPVLTPH